MKVFATPCHVFLFFVVCTTAVRAQDNLKSLPIRSRKVCELKNEQIAESSGVAISYRNPGIFWTHNDSGDRPRLFAFDQQGNHLSECRLKGAEAVDWEDMASFQRDGKSWLLVADVGDNAVRRRTSQLYLCAEPPLDSQPAEVIRIDFRYEDGPHNCEAISVDGAGGLILLVTKVAGPQCRVYELALPSSTPGQVLVARSIATVTFPLVTGMDISPDSRRAVIVTYADAFEFERKGQETWREAFSRQPRHLSLPARRQGESICYGLDSSTLYLTSEKLPTPLWEVSVEREKE